MFLCLKFEIGFNLILSFFHFSCHFIALPPHMALLSIQATSPERRFTQKEIIAGEERPKYLLIKHQDQAPAAGTNATSTTSGIFIRKFIESLNFKFNNMTFIHYFNHFIQIKPKPM